MAKKKSQARQNKRAQTRQNRRGTTRVVDQARENAESQRAIKTLMMGALMIAIVSAFFAFKWDGKSVYDRIVGEASTTQNTPASP